MLCKHDMCLSGPNPIELESYGGGSAIFIIYNCAQISELGHLNLWIVENTP